MRKINNFENLKKLLCAPLFSSKDAKQLGVSSSLLCYYVKKGLLERVDRGLYRKTGATLDVDFKWEDLIITSKGIPNGVICLISALAIYDLTDEIPRSHWIAIPHKNKAPKRIGVRIVRMRNIELGKTKLIMGETTVTIFDRERTIIDAFRYLSIEIAIKALKQGLLTSGNEKINLITLQSYAKTLRFNIAPYLMAVST
jgi:predicted transcriptional regulator of viral defense system